MLLSVQTAAEQPARQQPSMLSSRTRVALAAGLVAMGVEMGVGLRILIAICCRMDWIACSSSATKNQKRTKFAQSNAANIFPSPRPRLTRLPRLLLVGWSSCKGGDITI